MIGHHVDQLFVVTRGGDLWLAEQANARLATLNKLTGRKRTIPGGAVGLTQNLGAVVYLDAIPGRRFHRPDANHQWQGNTAPIVAAFIQRDDAFDCCGAISKAPFEAAKPWDSRWEGHSKTAMHAIGDTHPWIALCKSTAEMFLGTGLMAEPVEMKRAKLYKTHGGMFTDADCPHCRRPNLNATAGIRTCTGCEKQFEAYWP